MRKLAFLIAMLAVAAFPGSGHAATLAGCAGSAALTGIGVPPNPTASGSCHTTLALSTYQPVSISLDPGVGFVGTLRVIVYKIGGESYPLFGFFLNNQAISGTSSLNVTLTPGMWNISVTAGATGSCLTPYSPCVAAPGLAFGPFAASISNATE